MLETKKLLIPLLIIGFVLSASLNIHSFTSSAEQREKEREHVKTIIEGKEETINHLRAERSKKEAERMNLSDTKREPTEPESGSVETNETSLVHVAERFMEGTFNVSPETYAAQKKVARSYMTNQLYETIYTADGIDANAQKVTLQLGDMVVYVNAKTNDEVIVFYELREEIVATGYKETTQNYLTLEIKEEDGLLKISAVKEVPIVGGA